MDNYSPEYIQMLKGDHLNEISLQTFSNSIKKSVNTTKKIYKVLKLKQNFSNSSIEKVTNKLIKKFNSKRKTLTDAEIWDIAKEIIKEPIRRIKYDYPQIPKHIFYTIIIQI